MKVKSTDRYQRSTIPFLQSLLNKEETRPKASGSSSRLQNSNKPSEYGGYTEICTRSGTYTEYPIRYTNLAPNRALYGIGSKLSRLRDSTRSGTPFMYPIGYTICTPNQVQSLKFLHEVKHTFDCACTNFHFCGKFIFSWNLRWSL